MRRCLAADSSWCLDVSSWRSGTWQPCCSVGTRLEWAKSNSITCIICIHVTCYCYNTFCPLYIHQNIIIDSFSSFDDDTCNAVVCLSTKSNCIISCLYRPPGCDLGSFSNALNFISDFINSNNNLDKLQCFLFGDFNFPQLNWYDNQITKFTSPSELELN